MASAEMCLKLMFGLYEGLDGTNTSTTYVGTVQNVEELKITHFLQFMGCKNDSFYTHHIKADEFYIYNL